MVATLEKIQLVDIEKELKRLSDEELGKKRTRACFFNLVILAQKEANENYCALIDSVLAKFPCRVFFISKENGDDAYLRTQVSAKTLSPEIFCEVIQIDVGSHLIDRVPFILLPHLIPDLPLYLLWTQDPSQDNTLLPHLLPYAKKLILDLDAFTDLVRTSQNILSHMKSQNVAIGDLHWSALKGWRKIFASMFDTPEMIDILQKSETVEITTHLQNPLKGYYFQAWLASCLRWKFESFRKENEKIHLTYAGGHEVTIILHEDPLEKSTLLPGTLLSVEIQSPVQKSHFSFRRQSETKQVYFQSSDQNRCDLPKCLFLSGITEGQEIIDEIFYPEKTTHYQKMLEMLSQTVEKK